MELSGSTLNGLPQAISIDDITTVWPCLLSDFEHNLVTDFNHSTVSLLDPDLYRIVMDTSWDNVKGMFAKACLLITHTMTLENQRLLDPKGTEEWWTLKKSIMW
ncbi:hypothetical protein CTheo_8799 [Ceratobasidium theobromae]|uniref:Uncharacterized protein n=1 Tax=Ceratobasidium theobromae TaxID=1582974 RepID=A0A5N5Q7U2_9AGAM|nr:hypothetical protein CTheo_8799 [Ceratobasidium theobromae]